MPFPSALTSPDYTNLRAGGHKSNQYLLLGSNTTIFAARVNGSQRDPVNSSITFDTVTTGAYTDIWEGDTVFVGGNSKRLAYFIGRVRADNSGVVSTSTVLNINETSSYFGDNDFIFVVRDHRLFHELGRYAGGVYYKDYARTFSALKPIIYGLQSAYAGIVSGSPLGFTVSFAASAVAAASGATISSYAYTLPSGATATAGSVSTANVTVRFDASATEYWVRLVVTDSGGRTQSRYIPVFAIPADLSTTIYLGASGASIEGDIDNGYSASIEAFTGFTSVLDNTLAVIFDVEYYGTTQTSLVSSVKFVGRIRRETDPTTASDTSSVSRKAQVEIEGIAAQMARITTPKITMRDSSAAAAWDEITKLTIWRSVAYVLEHSTFHNICSLSFDSTSDTYLAYQLAAAQGNILSAANDLMKAINGALEFAPTGEVRAVRNLNFLSFTERNLLTVVADFDTQDLINFTPDHQHVDTIGLVEASGGTYNRSGGILASMVTPRLSVAPGVAQGNAEGASPLPGQILVADSTTSAAQLELNTRAADQYVYANGNDELTVDLRTGYNWITPSRYQYYTWTIDDTDNVFGRSYTTDDRWWCKSVSSRHDNASGKKDVQAVFVLETAGYDAVIVGQSVPIPAPQTTPPTLPGIPPVTPYPNDPTPPPIYLPPDPTPPQLPPMPPVPGTPLGIPVDGNAVVYWSSDHIWYTRNFLGLNTAFDITPDDLLGTIRDFALVGQGGYLLSSDDTDSTVYYRSNVFDSGSTWTDSGTLSGIYNAVRPASTEGDVYIIANGAETTTTYDFAISDYGFTVSAYSATYTPGVGWESGSGAGGQVVYISKTIASTIVTSATMEWFFFAGAPAENGFIKYGSVNDSFIGGSPHTTTQTDTTTTFELAIGNGGGGTPTGVLTGFSFTSPGSSGAQTRYSSDFGATFASAVSVGTALGFVGIDTEKIGVPVIAGIDSQVRIATSAGGAYSDYGSATPTGVQPTALVLPRYQFGSTSSGNVTTNTPQYLIGSSVLGSSNEAVLKVTASGATFTDITPVVSGDYGLVINHRSLAMPWWSGSRIAGVLMFGSSPRLVVSTNAGGAYTDRGILDDDASMVTYRKGDRTMTQLFLTNGGPAYSPDHGATIVTKSYPADSATEPVIGIAVYG